MAAASALMGQPGAASDIARRIAGLVSTHTHTAAGTIEAGETVEAAGTREPGSLVRLMVWWAP